MLNCFLKVAKLILTCDFEKLWMACCETQSELQIFLLFVLSQTKPVDNGDAPKRAIIWNERINVRARVATQRAEVDDGPTVINNLSKIVDRFSADGIESHLELLSSQGLSNLFFPVAVAG